MLYNPPTGGAANDPYVGKNVAAGTQGSKVPPVAIESVQREIVAVITAAGLNPTNSDWQQLLRAMRSGVPEYYVDTGAVNAPAIAPSPAHTALVDGLHVRVRMKFAPTGPTNFAINTLGAPVTRIGGIALAGNEWGANDVVDLVYNGARNAFQIAGLTKSDVSQATYGATSQGGLAKDGSNNFLLSLIQNLTADNRTAPVAADILALGRVADGAMVGVSAAKLASYILSNIVASNTFQQVAVNPVLYVDATNGLDTNPGTQAAPFKTLAAALAFGTGAYNFTSGTLTVNLAAGTYTAPQPLPVGSGTISIIGNASNPGAYTISGSGGSGVVVAQSKVNLIGLTVQNTGTTSDTAVSSSGGNLFLSNVNLVTTASGSTFSHISANGGIVVVSGPISVSGSMGALFSSISGGQMTLFGAITLLGSPTFSIATAVARIFGLIIVEGGATGVTFTGSATGPRYSAIQNSVISILNGGGANAFPGTTAGTTATGGIYG